MKAEGVFPLGRPRVLAVLPQFIPSSILTIVKPLTALHRAGQIVADITLEAWVSHRKVERADVVVFSRNTEPICGYVLETALALKKPVIYHLDDNFFEIPSFTRLIEDARLRAKIQEQALQYAREHCSLEKAQAAWFDDIQGVITNTRNSSSMKQHPITHQDTRTALFPFITAHPT